MENKNTILVVGQAKPSKEDAIYNLHGEFYISLIVERDTGKILELDCNTILEVTKQFVASMFVGKSLRTDVPLIEKEIRERYFALTQKPLIACMKDACNRYLTAIGENRGKYLRGRHRAGCAGIRRLFPNRPPARAPLPCGRCKSF